MSPSIEKGVRGVRGRMKLRDLLLAPRPHVAVIGGTGAGKTTLAKAILAELRRPFYIVDWDGEYNLPVPEITPPFPLPSIDIPTLISELDRPSEGGHGIAAAVLLAAEGRPVTSLRDLARSLRALSLTFPRGEVVAALARVEVLARWFMAGELPPPPVRFDLSPISSIRERAWVQQALATSIVLSLKHEEDVLLVLEEGGMGSTQNFLKDLMAHARRRRIRLIFISQHLPPPELRDNFVYLLAPGPARYEWARELGLPALPSADRGEFWFLDGKRVERVKLPR